ncbi:unnamed protein product [Rhizoctonia solani]|uniref:RING-type E3 ubiquitin transferase n=1 Tax=Rhizoctonia solani TaxID=456999 RepID=A0A8H2WHF0_9AGAM|nr:unnamed protein product [Rhizoctonia solani]
MNQPSTPTRPRQTANGPPRRSSTRNRRVTRSVTALQNNRPPSSSLSPLPEQQQGGANHITTVPADDIIPQIDPVAAATTLHSQALTSSTTAPKKRRTPAEDDDDPTDGPLLSEYMCPICLSPPSSAIVTLCGHIMCGPCLYGALTARGAPAQKLCPVCRTPIPNVQFTRAQAGNPAPAAVPPPQAPPPAVPQPRTTRNGIRLPTAARDMVLNQNQGMEQEPEVIDVDVDMDMDEPARVETRWDPSRSGVIGLEVLTLGVDEVM